MSPRLPPQLQTGDRVRVVSPSGPVTDANLAAGLSVLESWGLEVELDASIWDRAEPGYLAGDDHVRRNAVQTALDDDISAVIFSRGGYGLTRYVDDLDFSALNRAPKWVVGFSDVTAFHLAAIARRAPVITVHGHVVKSMGSQTEDLDALRALLFDGVTPMTRIQRIAGDGDNLRGTAIGGNLSLIAAMLDGRSMPDLEGTVLFLEDVGEADYRLDRLVTSLGTSRRAEGVRGVVFGEFTNCDGVYVSPDALPSFLVRLGNELGERLDCPVYAGFPSGHGARNLPIPIGAAATIDGGTIRFEVAHD